jgi:hypothetical protein
MSTSGMVIIVFMVLLLNVVLLVMFINLCSDVRRIVRATEATARAVSQQPPQMYPPHGPPYSGLNR